MRTQHFERLLWTATGVVEAPLDDVADLVLRAEAGEVASERWFVPHVPVGAGLALTGGPVRFGVLPHGLSVPTSYIEVDRARRTLAVEGRWWFRGVYAFEAHPNGTLVTYRVYDMARTARWAVPLLLLQNRLSGSFNGRTVDSQEGLLSVIGRRLARPARIARPADRPGR